MERKDKIIDIVCNMLEALMFYSEPEDVQKDIQKTLNEKLDFKTYVRPLKYRRKIDDWCAMIFFEGEDKLRHVIKININLAIVGSKEEHYLDEWELIAGSEIGKLEGE